MSTQTQPAAAGNVPADAMENFVSPKPRTARDVMAGIIHRSTPDPGMDRRLTTGFHPLDSVLDGGFSPQDLVLLGGKPGVGKTIAMVQWARNMAQQGARVVFASYELSERNLLGRLLSAEVCARHKDLDSTAKHRLKMIILDSIKAGAVAEDQDVRGVIREAYDAIDEYADRLLLQRVSGYHTGPSELNDLAAEWVGPGGALFVDYLQKVPVRGAKDDSERVLTVAESLKETAMTHDVCVVAAAAVNAEGLGQRRLRLEHMRGSALLAHEVDLAIAMNEKSTALSKSHLAYDPHLLEASKNQIVFSIEKNREGPANVHLEFDKEFEDYRFNPAGGFVAQRLTDDTFEE
ncbi:MAG: DnaB-like helicase C-terminal domain-containing protein [Acidimicrobiales bacterium]